MARARGADPRQGRAWVKLRARVVRRAHGICALCGRPGADTADHILPLARGGAHTLANLQAAHRTCNRAKGADPGPLGAPSRRW